MQATGGGRNGFHNFNGGIKNGASIVTTGIVARHKQTQLAAQGAVSITASLEERLNGAHVAEWSLGIIQSQIRRLFDGGIQFPMALSVVAVLMTYFQGVYGISIDEYQNICWIC